MKDLQKKDDLEISGKLIRKVSDRTIWWCGIDGPKKVIQKIKKSKIKADIFTFMQRPPDFEPKYEYFYEWDNIAAIPITSFENWWTKQISYKTRNMARKAGKKGVEIRTAQFDDEFIKGIKDIYNETPYRQGRPFHHFGKNHETVKLENSKYIERSDLIGAYYNNELIGFVKLVYDEYFASMMQIIAKINHRDKSPSNALIAKAVELCAEKNVKYLVYSKFIYGKKGEDSLAKFKRNNGFLKYDLPKYYIALNKKGKFAIDHSLHRGFFELLPKSIVIKLMEYRDRYYKLKLKQLYKNKL
jgi:hypothetical protein